MTPLDLTTSHIVFLGATGYVGGVVLTHLLSHPGVRSSNITAFVRSKDKAQILQQQFRCKAVVGSFDDSGFLENLASQADVLFSCAEVSDNPPAMEALLKGLKRRHAEQGIRPVLIHTSGTGVLACDAKGMYASDKIYDDTDVNAIESLPADAPHRPVDVAVVAADQAGYLRSHIILPGTVWGIASGPLVTTGIQRHQSAQIPALIRVSLDRKRAGMVGKGFAMKPNVNVDELAELFMTLFDAIVKGSSAVAHGREGYYFAENGEHTWYDISKEIARALVVEGISQDSEPSTFTTEELVKYWGSEKAGNAFGASSRCRATRSRQLGWKPMKGTADMLQSIAAEVTETIKQLGTV